MQKQGLKKIGFLIIALVVDTIAYGQNYAAKVVKRPTRYAESNPTPNPNAKALPASKAVPAATKETSGPVEEDLAPPSTGAKAKPKRLRKTPDPQPKHLEQIPPTEAPPKELPRVPKAASEIPPATPPPEFSERGDEQPGRAGDIEEDGDIGYSLGIGFGASKFSGSLGAVFPIYRWLAWTLSGSYETWADGDDKSTRYGPETSLMIRIQTRLPITPFAGAGGGFDTWTRKQNEVKFDDSSCPLGLYYLGVSIPMAKHLAIDISETWRTYLGNPPRRFDDHTKRERFGSARFDVGLSVHF